MKTSEERKKDVELITQIVDRAVLLGIVPRETWAEVRADILIVHMTNPLRLADLLVADHFNFAHDIGGIRRNLNQETGMMENCFSPRYTERKTK